ncbi:MAG: hypothetical protein Q4A82_05100 [Corynebacterium sp.]|nr:hypothetical protein [Corynebacterium sp.]
MPLPRFTLTVAASVAAIVVLPCLAWLTYSMQTAEPDISDISIAALASSQGSGSTAPDTTNRVVTPLADGSLAAISYDDPNTQNIVNATASQAGLPICECLHDLGPGATLMCDGTLLYTEHCVDTPTTSNKNDLHLIPQINIDTPAEPESAVEPQSDGWVAPEHKEMPAISEPTAPIE